VFVFNESGSDASVSEVEISSDSDSSVDVQAEQRAEVKTSGLPHSTKQLCRTRDDLE
jgi:hypothetical protein